MFQNLHLILSRTYWMRRTKTAELTFTKEIIRPKNRYSISWVMQKRLKMNRVLRSLSQMRTKLILFFCLDSKTGKRFFLPKYYKTVGLKMADHKIK